MKRTDLLNRVDTAIQDAQRHPYHGGTIECSIDECENPATRDPLPRPNGGRRSGIPHAHYATPMTVNVGALAVVSVGGVEVVNGARRKQRISAAKMLSSRSA